MMGLIKVDFKRVLKDKLFLVLCIVAGAFALVTPLMNALLFGDMSKEMLGELSLMGVSVTGRSLFFAAFSPADNVGLVLPILLGIILCKDFGQGTVRNKIIGGKSRSAIFLSTFVVCFTVMIGVLFAHALLSLLMNLIFFPFQTTPFTASDLGYILLSFLLILLLYFFMAAFISFLCATMRSAGLVILLHVATTMVMSIVGAILQVGDLIFTMSEDAAATSVIAFIRRINVFGYGSAIGQGMSYDSVDLLFYVFTPVLLGAGLLLLGMRSFGRKDLK